MSFVNLFSTLATFVCGQTIKPDNVGFINHLGSMLGNFFAGIGQAICVGFYFVCKWMLAVVDFLQYFIQKLIGLDYWLKSGKKTIQGATDNDLLFKFLYNDMVQKVFRAMTAVFVVLLIIFTVVAIIRQEWGYITGGNFGDGKNSKNAIILKSLKAIALVLVFPMILIVGVISSNAILASLVNALNIDMASTFGGSIFSIAAQTGSRYRIYADGNKRSPVSQEVTFYVNTTTGKCLMYGTGNESNITYESSYKDYLTTANGLTEYKINSVFKAVNPNDYTKKNPFYGYCVQMEFEDKVKPMMVYCESGEKEKYFYYLKNILGVRILSSNDQFNSDIYGDVKNKMKSKGSGSCPGFISGLRLDDVGKGDLIDACYNSWNYASIYMQKTDFELSLDYGVLNNTELEAFGVGSVSNAKVMFNSANISPYMDGGQFGVVQLRSEYYVTAEVIDFINEKQAPLYIMDATSSSINWSKTGYQIDSKWKSVKKTIGGDDYYNFIATYSESCPENEVGNVLYTAKFDTSSELYGSKYIFCWKRGNEYLPLINGYTGGYVDEEGTRYDFKSSYYSDSYKGVVFAKGVFDTTSTNQNFGEPTYIQTSATGKDGDDPISISDEKAYYYKMEQSGAFKQYVDSVATDNKSFDLAGISLPASYSTGYKLEGSVLTGTTDKVYKLQRILTEEDGSTTMEYSAFNESLVTELTFSVTSGNTYVGTYSGVKNKVSNTLTRYLFVTSNNYYFIVEHDSKDEFIRIVGVASTGEINELGSDTINGLRVTYALKYQYKTYSVETIDAAMASEFFEYTGQKNGYSVFRTEEMQFIKTPQTGDNGKPLINKAMYINAVFDTTSETLVYFGEVDDDGNGSLLYAAPVTDDSLRQQSVFYDFYLYSFMHGYVGGAGSGTVYKYIIDDNGNASTDVIENKEVIDDMKFSFSINSDFDWALDSLELALYDGKSYVATIYKTQQESTDPKVNIDSIMYIPTKVNYEGKVYHNIQRMNRFDTLGNMEAYFGKVSKSLIIGFYRDNANTKFWHFDSNIGGLISGKFRLKVALFVKEIETEMNNYFTIDDGLLFDYFFDGPIKLGTFYVPSKVASPIGISFWIIMIASALIIKVLGTSLWGVIKRFYEITLYYLAMPAVASTMPLDEKDTRFKTAIQTPLIGKVLSTYGVILGINAFFVLLAPVRSLSKVFTAEDIATSGSYFLQHLPISVNLLNSYVYILFLLVAFTMINSLPGTISMIVTGKEGNDILSSGEKTKKAVGETMKQAGGVISGQSMMEGVSKMAKGAASFIPGGAIAKKAAGGIAGGVNNMMDRFKDDGGDDEGGGDKETGSKRTGGDEEGGETTTGGGGGTGGGGKTGDGETSSNRTGEDDDTSTGGDTETSTAEGDPLDTPPMENSQTAAGGTGTPGADTSADAASGEIPADGTTPPADGEVGPDGKPIPKEGETAEGEVPGDGQNPLKTGVENANNPDGTPVDPNNPNDPNAKGGAGEPKKPKGIMDLVEDAAAQQKSEVKSVKDKAGEMASGTKKWFANTAVGKAFSTGKSWVNKTKKFVKEGGVGHFFKKTAPEKVKGFVDKMGQKFKASKLGKKLSEARDAVSKSWVGKSARAVGKFAKKVDQGLGKAVSFVKGGGIKRFVKTQSSNFSAFVKNKGTAFIAKHPKLQNAITKTKNAALVTKGAITKAARAVKATPSTLKALSKQGMNYLKNGATNYLMSGKFGSKAIIHTMAAGLNVYRGMKSVGEKLSRTAPGQKIMAGVMTRKAERDGRRAEKQRAKEMAEYYAPEHEKRRKHRASIKEAENDAVVAIQTQGQLKRQNNDLQNEIAVLSQQLIANPNDNALRAKINARQEAYNNNLLGIAQAEQQEAAATKKQKELEQSYQSKYGVSSNDDANTVEKKVTRGRKINELSTATLAASGQVAEIEEKKVSILKKKEKAEQVYETKKQEETVLVAEREKLTTERTELKAQYETATPEKKAEIQSRIYEIDSQLVDNHAALTEVRKVKRKNFEAVHGQTQLSPVQDKLIAQRADLVAKREASTSMTERDNLDKQIQEVDKKIETNEGKLYEASLSKSQRNGGYENQLEGLDRDLGRASREYESRKQAQTTAETEYLQMFGVEYANDGDVQLGIKSPEGSHISAHGAMMMHEQEKASLQTEKTSLEAENESLLQKRKGTTAANRQGIDEQIASNLIAIKGGGAGLTDEKASLEAELKALKEKKAAAKTSKEHAPIDVAIKEVEAKIAVTDKAITMAATMDPSETVGIEQKIVQLDQTIAQDEERAYHAGGSYITASGKRARIAGPNYAVDSSQYDIISEGVNDERGIRFSSSFVGAGASGKGRTAGKMIARAIETGTPLTAQEVEAITVAEFNETAIGDTDFIDNKTSARANLVRNKVGTGIGRQVVAEALATFAESKIDENLASDSSASTAKKVVTAITGGNGNKGLLTADMRTDLILSTMSKEDIERYNGLGAAGKASMLASYKTTTSVGADGAIGFTVTSKDGSAVKVDSQTTDKIVSKMMSSENISDTAIETAINKTGAADNIDRALSQNIAAGIDFTSANANTTTSMLASAVYGIASQDDDMVAEAMLRHIEGSKGTELYDRFQYELNLGDADLSDKATRSRVIDQIKMFKKSDNPNIITTMDSEAYGAELTEVVQEKVASGSFKVTAWDLADEETKDTFSNKTAANLREVSNHSILDGATDEEKTNIIANTVTNVMQQSGSNSPVMQQIQQSGFIANVTEQEIKNMNPQVMQALVGKDNVDALTAEDKAFLGYVKASNGGSFDGVYAQKADTYKRAYSSNASRVRAFVALDNDAKAKAVSENNMSEVYAQAATQDGVLALTKDTLNGVQVDFVKNSMKNGAAKEELQRMYKAQNKGAVLADASDEELIKFLSGNQKASNLVMSQMRAVNYSFAEHANSNYSLYYARTEDERKKEHELSVLAVKQNAPHSVYNAFISSNTENKSVITSDLFAKFANIETTSSAGYVEALSEMKKNNIDMSAFTSQGYSEANVVAAYKKAQMFGENVKDITVLESYLESSPEEDIRVLKKMQTMTKDEQKTIFKGGANYNSIANTLMADYLTPEQKDGLIEAAATSGYAGLTAKDQDAVLVAMAKKDGQAYSNAITANKETVVSSYLDVIKATTGYNNTFTLKNGHHEADFIADIARNNPAVIAALQAKGKDPRYANTRQITDILKADKSIKDSVVEDAKLARYLINNGFNAKDVAKMSAEDKNNAVFSLAEKNQGFIDSKIGAYLSSDEGEKDRKRLEARTGSMSYYELHRMREDGATSAEIYNEIKLKSAEGKDIDEIYRAQGSFITSEDIHSDLITNQNIEANAQIAAAYASKITTLSSAEQYQISIDSQYASIDSDDAGKALITKINTENATSIQNAKYYAMFSEIASNESYVGFIQAVKATSEFKAEKEANGSSFDERLFIGKKLSEQLSSGVSYTIKSGTNKAETIFQAFNNSGAYSSLIEQIRSSKEYKEESKKDTFNDHDFVGAKLEEMVNGGILERGQALVESVNERTEKQEVIRRISDYDTGRALQLDQVSTEAINLENKRRLALGSSSRIDDYARAIMENRGLARKAAQVFRSQKEFEGKELTEVDETTRNNFLANTFLKSLTKFELEDVERDREVIDARYVRGRLGEGGESKLKNISIDESSKKYSFHSIEDFVSTVKAKGISVDDALAKAGLVESEASMRATAEAEYAAKNGIAQADMTVEQKKVAYEQYLDNQIVSKMSDADFRAIYDESKLENYGEEAEIFKNIKKDMIGRKAETSEITVIPDVSKMSDKQRSDYTYRRNLIQQEIRNGANPQILANTFKNSTVVNEDAVVNAIVQSIVKADKSNISDADKRNNAIRDILKQNQEFVARIGGEANIDEVIKNGAYNIQDLKKGLSDESIDKYLSQNEKLKENLVSIAASDVLLTLNAETRGVRQLDAVLSNRALQTKTAEEAMTAMYSKIGSDGKAKLDDTKITQMIRDMLSNERSKYYNKDFAELMKAKDQNKANTYANQYISQNYKELFSQLSLETFFNEGKNGTLALKESVTNASGQSVNAADAMRGAIDSLSRTSTTYKNAVYDELTKVISPSSRSTIAEKKNFFTSERSDANASQVKTLGAEFSSLAGTLARFNKRRDGSAASLSQDGLFGSIFNISKNIGTELFRTTKGGVVSVVDGAFNGAVYKLTKKLPKTHAKYDQWNNLIQKKIDDVKRGQGEYQNFTRTQREAEVKKLESQKIVNELPDNYYDMSSDEQATYIKQQNLYKHEAFTTNISKVIKQNEKMTAPTNRNIFKRFADSAGYTFGFVGGMASENVKARHKQDLADIEAIISRYNATKAMRNKSVDFGSNFNNFVKNYFGDKEAANLDNAAMNKFLSEVRGQVDATGKMLHSKNLKDFKFGNLTAAQQTKLMQIREDTFAGKLNQRLSVATKKVAADNKVDPQTYSQSKGITTTGVRYRNGAEKYLNVQSQVKARGYKSYMGSTESKVASENRLIDLQSKYDKVLEFNKNYKGSREDYKSALAAYINDADLINKIYARYNSMFGSKKTSEFNLERSSVAGQLRSVERGLLTIRQNELSRAKYAHGFIPASNQTSSGYIGRQFTNAITKVEMDKDRNFANEISNTIKQFNIQKKSLSYDQLYAMLTPALRNGFTAHNKVDFTSYSDDRKKDELMKYLQRRHTKAVNKVNNNMFFAGDKHKLINLNGTYVERSSVTKTGVSPVIMNAIKTSGSTVYQNLVQNFNSARTKVDLEEKNIERLSRSLKELMSGPQNAATRRQAQMIRQALESSRVKLKTYNSMYADAESKKKAFEQSFATREIKQAVAKNTGMAINTTAAARELFAKYRFPIKGDGVNVVYVKEGTPQAKEVTMIIGDFLRKYKYQIQYMIKQAVAPELKELRKDLGNDFGRNYANLKTVTKSLKAQIKKNAQTASADNRELNTKLTNNLTKIQTTERELIYRLRALGIDVNDISQIVNSGTEK